MRRRFSEVDPKKRLGHEPCDIVGSSGLERRLDYLGTALR